MLEVAEIFTSIQGEGPLMGRPARFLRLSGCIEPICPWCDTPEGLRKGRFMTKDEVVRALGLSSGSLLVITGGEPFLQWDSGLKELEKDLVRAGIKIQYETSAKIPLPVTAGYIVCSPKYLSGKWQIAEQNIRRPEVFKFIAQDSFNHISDFISRHRISKNRVWIMPFGATREEQLIYAEGVWRFCSAHNYNFSARLHILTHDSQRGI